MNERDRIVPFLLISFCIHIRIDSCILLFPLCLLLLLHKSKKSINVVFSILWTAVLVFSCVTLFVMMCDYWFTGTFTCPLWNNFLFNIYHNYSSLYGQSSFFTYFFGFTPLYLNVFIPFLLYSLKSTPTYNERTICVLSWNCFLFSIFVFSCVSHKEDRFILPSFVYLYPVLLSSFSFFLSTTSKRAQYTIVF